MKDLRYQIEHTTLQPFSSKKDISVILKEKGYNVISSDEYGNFCIGIEENCFIEGVAVSKVKYTLILRIGNIEEKFEKIYRYDDFTPIIDILITEGKKLYPIVIEVQKKEKKTALFQAHIDGILSTKNLYGREFLFNPQKDGDNISMVMYTKILPGLQLGVKLTVGDLENKIDRLLKVCSAIPDIVSSERPISLEAKVYNGWSAIYVKTEGLNKNYDKPANRHFIDDPYTKKSVFLPRAQKLVKFLNKTCTYE